MSGHAAGNILECRIYASSDGAADEATDVADANWNLVFSNVTSDTADQKVGLTERLAVKGATEAETDPEYDENQPVTVYRTPEPWTTFESLNKNSWDAAHVAVFKEVVRGARFVKMEVVKTQSAEDYSHTANKWISGRRVYIYEAQEVKATGEEIKSVRLDISNPIFGVQLGRVETPNDTPYYAQNLDFVWEKKVTGVWRRLIGSSAGTTDADLDPSDIDASEYRVTVNLKSKDHFTIGTTVSVYDAVTKELIAPNDDKNLSPLKSVEIDNVTSTPDEQGFYRCTIICTYHQVSDPTDAMQDLANTVKELWDKYEAGNQEGTADGDGIVQKYTESTWNNFAYLFLTARTWTMEVQDELPDVESGTAPSQDKYVVKEKASGHTATEYVQLKADLIKANKDLVAIAGRQDLGRNANVDVSVTGPVADATIAAAQTNHAGDVDPKTKEDAEHGDIVLIKGDDFGVKKFTVTGENGTKSEVSYVTGKIAAEDPDALEEDGTTKKNGNDIFRIKKGDNFLIYTKIVVPQAVSSKQSIVGNFDQGFGLQLNGNQLVFFACVKRAALDDKGEPVWQKLSGTQYVTCNRTDEGAELKTEIKWPQNSYTINDQSWYGKEHEILAFYNGTKVFMYVDGVRATDDRKNQFGTISSAMGTEADAEQLTGSNDNDTKNKRAESYSRFSIGYNYINDKYSGATYTGGTRSTEAFTGGIDDFRMYIGEDCLDMLADYKVNGPFEDYVTNINSWYVTPQNEDEAYAPETNYSREGYKRAFIADVEDAAITAAMTPDNALDVFDESGQEADIIITAVPSDYKVTKTEWREVDSGGSRVVNIGDQFHRYMDYKVTVEVTADAGYKFSGDMPTGKLYNGTIELPEGSYTAKLSSDLSKVTYVYTFESTDQGTHPYYELVDAINALPTEKHVSYIDGNVDADGNRKYTVKSWEAFEIAYRAANELIGTIKHDEASLQQYRDAKTTLNDAADGLLLAAETCECDMTEIAPKSAESISVTMSAEEMTKEVDPRAAVEVQINRDDCIKCKADDAENPTYEYEVMAGSTGAAEQTENETLNITSPGTINLKVKATLNGKMLETTLTYVVTGTPAGDNDKATLNAAITKAQTDYPAKYYSEEDYAALDNAIKDAQAAINKTDVTVQELNDKANKITEAGNALKDPKLAAVANVKKAVEAAQATKEAGKGTWSETTWSAFETAYNNANKDFTALKAMDVSALNGLVSTLNATKGALRTDSGSGNGGDNGNGGGNGITPPPVTGPQVGDPVEDANFNYVITDVTAKTVKLVSVKADKKTLKVPKTVNEYTVTAIGDGAFTSCKKKLKTVTIGANVTTIGKNAFKGCKKLKTVKIENNSKLTSVQKTAFKKCAKGISTKLPKSLKKNKKLQKALKKSGLKVK
ncbi:MAG: leucine-rich repeat protein [Lachnospiraceae bacterium]|nr:leucine-rich repeat protein [Lachnospiraceae bacterium]